MVRKPPSDISWSGERVQLRYPQLADRAAYFELRQASEAHLAPWNPLRVPGSNPYTVAAFDELLANACTDRRHGLFIVRKSDGEILGGFNINEMAHGCFQSAYLGYWISDAHKGQGYMTEAMQIGLQVAFGPVGLHRVEANIMPRNAASMRVVEKLGFRREGLSARYLKIAGVWEDHVRWAMTIEDWQER